MHSRTRPEQLCIKAEGEKAEHYSCIISRAACSREVRRHLPCGSQLEPTPKESRAHHPHQHNNSSSSRKPPKPPAARLLGTRLPREMCDVRYRLLWWPLAPYAEPHSSEPSKSTPADQTNAPAELLGLEGLLLNTLDALFKVCRAQSFTRVRCGCGCRMHSFSYSTFNSDRCAELL